MFPRLRLQNHIEPLLPPPKTNKHKEQKEKGINEQKHNKQKRANKQIKTYAAHSVKNFLIFSLGNGTKAV